MSIRDLAIPVVGLILLFAGAYYSLEYPGMFAPVALGMVGGMVVFFGWVRLMGTINRSGLGPLIFQRLGPRDVLLLWISGSGKAYPIIARETVYEKYLTLPVLGRLRIPKGSMYVLPTGRKIGIAVAGISHVVPAEQAKVAMELKEMGFRDFQDVETFVRNYPLFLRWLGSLSEEEKKVVKENAYQFLEWVKEQKPPEGGGEVEKAEI